MIMIVHGESDVHGRARKRGRSLRKFGVPRPDTGSHPGRAANPSVPHPGLFPTVMSLNALSNEYSCHASNAH